MQTSLYKKNPGHWSGFLNFIATAPRRRNPSLPQLKAKIS
jgi:hypothetical protein